MTQNFTLRKQKRSGFGRRHIDIVGLDNKFYASLMMTAYIDDAGIFTSPIKDDYTLAITTPRLHIYLLSSAFLLAILKCDAYFTAKCAYLAATPAFEAAHY